MRVFPSSLINDDFLRRYWQKKPLLMRRAVSLPADLVTKSKLLALACGSEDVESRLILEHGETPWEAHHGPFERTKLEQLAESHWTLLIQDMNRHMPEIRPLLDAFSAFPQWRIDDIMISYAEDQGSVGPHLDEYDVFLIQASGRRRWRIDHPPMGEPLLIPDLELGILQSFRAREQWVLAPGDILYLPPGVPHWGIAEGPCMTWSVGLRAPDWRELATAWWCDDGIAAQSMLLGAREKELAGCMIGLIEKDDLRHALDISTRYEILLVIALGKPREEVAIEDVGPEGDIKYWRDEQGVHHVPKRPLKDLIIH